MFLKICMQIHSVIFAFSQQINKQKYVKTVISFGQVVKFLQHIKLKGGF